MIIAIDGPAASGKGTLARRLAEHFSIPHLDTGLTYRAVGNALLQVGLPLDDEAIAAVAAENLDLSKLDRAVLSSHAIGESASKIAVMKSVREILVNAQRAFAAKGPGAVLDGRDIGTVVCPDADVKFYVTASAEKRAERRFKEIGEKGSEASFEVILADIQKRDERDMTREESPLKPAQDAHLIDTSEMSIETAFNEALQIVKTAIASK
ncbi:MAG: (d)CMP kinase [Pseudomonadota bacterium]